MSRRSLLIVFIFTGMFGPPVFANDLLSGDYVLVQNDCMPSVAVGSQFTIQQTSESIKISGPQVNLEYMFGHEEHGPADDFFTSNGCFISAGTTFYFTQTEDTSAGAATSYSVAVIKEPS